MDKSDGAILRPSEDNAQRFLSDFDVEGQKKGEKSINWDMKKDETVQVQKILATGAENHQRQAERISVCAELLFFCWKMINECGEICLRFKKAYFCRVRNCPICQWRRSQMWVARFFQALPRIYAAYPTMRYVLLTLTVKNCPITELRSTTREMNKAWKRLSERKIFPALGFVRSLEVTKETDSYDKKTKKLIHQARPNYCHPHFHVILALPASYFSRNYFSTSDWAELWKNALRIDYTPICDVRLVKAKPISNPTATAPLDALQAAILETLKYTVKPSDMLQDRDWTLELVNQLHNSRAVALGGIFKEFLKEDEEEEPSDTEDQELQDGEYGEMSFGWRQAVKRYQYVPNK